MGHPVANIEITGAETGCPGGCCLLQRHDRPLIEVIWMINMVSDVSSEIVLFLVGRE